MKLTKLEQLAAAPVDEGIADAARNVKANLGNLKQTVAKHFNTDKGGKDNDKAAAITAAEFKTTCNATVTKADTSARALHANLVRQNIKGPEQQEQMLEHLKKHVGEMISKWRKGAALEMEADAARGYVRVRENRKLVRPFAKPLAIFAVKPITAENEERGPYFTVGFNNAELPQRTLNLQRLIDKKVQPVVAKSDTAPAPAPAAPSPAPPAPGPTPAPSPAPSAPHEAVAMDADAITNHLTALWDRWTETGKGASPAMRQLIRRMWLDTGGIKAESQQLEQR